MLARDQRIGNERETGLLTERAAAMDDMRKQIADLEIKMEHASTAAHTAEIKLVYAVSAVQLLAAKIRSDNPDDPTLKQAMELLAAATGGILPGVGIRLSEGLSNIRGTGEPL